MTRPKLVGIRPPAAARRLAQWLRVAKHAARKQTANDHPDTESPEGEINKLIDEQLELAAARIPAIAPTGVHPSHVGHEERAAAHPNLEDVLLGNADATPGMLQELADLQAAPELSEEELMRQALAHGGADDDDTSTPE